MKVFISIQGSDGSYKIVPAYDYQTDAYQTFMLSEKDEMNFNYPCNTYPNNSYADRHIFKIVKFDDKDLNGDYSGFCVLINDKNEHHILAEDQEKLRGFIGWRNRLTCI